MPATIKYAYLKQQTWLYRRNYPKHLQPYLGQALKRTQKNGDARVAKARVVEVNASYAKVVHEAEAQVNSPNGQQSDHRVVVTGPTTKFQRATVLGQVSVRDLAQVYLPTRFNNLSPGAFKSVRFSLGLLVSYLGHRKISDLNRTEGQTFLGLIAKLSPDVAKSAAAKGKSLKRLVALSKRTGKTISTQTQKRIWKQVCQFLDWATSEGHIGGHGFGALKVSGKVSVQSYAVLSDPEVTTLLTANDPDLTPILLLCLLSGLRSGEACGILAEDLVTRDNHGIFVRVRPNGIRGLKSKAAEREVPLHDQWLPILQGLPREGPLFPGLSVDRITKRFTSLRRKLDLSRPGLVFHSTRKWFITQCERTGVPEHFTASLVGHQSARSENKLTYGLYSAGISD
ncbi:MAG: tyrosine-type recombinase/integrase [Rhodobacteraceae bacterium]|nr:tyrosine-type recombinase/integrase [Paracoccaceae bacterium]